MKIFSASLLLQEVPDEISLGLTISNCPYRCAYCHTPELQKDVGTEWRELIDTEIEKYKDAISCVLFLGGDRQWRELYSAAKLVKEKYNLKTAVYLGGLTYPDSLLEVFDYIKVGPYVHELGGLSSPTTNQKLYRVHDKTLEDITSVFWRKYEN